jgi:uncharacterized protein YndB with AHSA1/START domain
MSTATDRIEKRVVLPVPRSRVWRALTDADEFGTWFGVKLEGPLREGATVRGQITHPGYEHLTMDVMVERIEPERYVAWRWHPHAIDPDTDYSNEPTTLVEFRLDESRDGTVLTIAESGFDRLPPGRRDEAFRMNNDGWTAQTRNIARHVSQS